MPSLISTSPTHYLVSYSCMVYTHTQLIYAHHSHSGDRQTRYVYIHQVCAHTHCHMAHTPTMVTLHTCKHDTHVPTSSSAISCDLGLRFGECLQLDQTPKGQHFAVCETGSEGRTKGGIPAAAHILEPGTLWDVLTFRDAGLCKHKILVLSYRAMMPPPRGPCSCPPHHAQQEVPLTAFPVNVRCF